MKLLPLELKVILWLYYTIDIPFIDGIFYCGKDSLNKLFINHINYDISNSIESILYLIESINLVSQITPFLLSLPIDDNSNNHSLTITNETTKITPDNTITSIICNDNVIGSTFNSLSICCFSNVQYIYISKNSFQIAHSFTIKNLPKLVIFVVEWNCFQRIQMFELSSLYISNYYKNRSSCSNNNSYFIKEFYNCETTEYYKY